MCNYGDSDPWTTTLSSYWIKRGYTGFGDVPSIWGSYNDFSGYGVEVPEQFLGMLIDGHTSGRERNKAYYQRNRLKWDYDRRRPKITWNAKRRVWRMTGGYHFNNEDGLAWLEHHGWVTRDEDGKYRVLKEFGR